MGVNQDALRAAVASATDECIVWPFYSESNGYAKIRHDGRSMWVHRVALLLTAGAPPTPLHQAAHGPCHNRSCVNPRHLRWLTRAENQLDRARDGTDIRGAKNPATRLTEADVRAIRRRRSAGESAQALGVEFGVSRQSVNDIFVGRRWRYVEDVAA